MTKIKILDNLTIQKIAAGEVIENPSSIVKELVENSIDANAKNIIIEIKNGGKSFIRVTDDGDGISKQDLEIAFERHSTSKLNIIEDIYNIISLGFRGEALASISSVSKMEVLTKTITSEVGVHAKVEEGKIFSMENAGTPKGTTMIVKNLFYNLPVRKKFLKTDSSEANKINDIIIKLALGNHDISFKFLRDSKTILQTSETKDLLDTIYMVLGKDFSDNLISINYKDNFIKISGYIGNNNLYRGNRGHQYLYINGRYILNYAISKAIENRFRSLIPLNRFPIFFLNIKINPNEIDVNIHPTKQEIKFIDNDRVIGTISNVINNNLMSSINLPKMQFNKDESKKKEELPKLFELNNETIDNESIDISENIIVRDFTDENFNISRSKDYKSDNMDYKEHINLNNSIYEEDNPVSDLLNKEVPAIEYKVDEFNVLKIEDTLLDIHPIGRVFDTYIIVESKNEDKLFFIDQHAAHERIMYEKYKKEYKNEKINTQQLMFPEIINLTASEMDKFENNFKIFIDLGFDLEEFGPNTIALRGVPMVFGDPKSKDLFLNIMDNLDLKIKSNYDTTLDKIMKIACTNAIKSGDKISDMEIMALFKDLQQCENPFTCPHGRPTIIEITKKDIEKQFLRIV